MICGFDLITLSFQQQQDLNLESIFCYLLQSKVKLIYPCGQTKTNCYPYVMNLWRGKYKFELEGGSDGTPLDNLGGKGGYVAGNIIILKPNQQFLLYIGASGVTASNT